MSDHPDARREQLRLLVAELDLAMPDSDATRSGWRRLVAALDLGPSPVVRACPRCGKLGMAAATRCGFCWASLAPAEPRVGPTP